MGRRAGMNELNVYGLTVLPRMLSGAECRRVLAELRRPGLRRSRAGMRHLLGTTAVADLAHASRLLEISAQALGGSATPFRATLFDKSADSNLSVVWHQDTSLPMRERFKSPEWGPWSVKSGFIYSHASS